MVFSRLFVRFVSDLAQRFFGGKRLVGDILWGAASHRGGSVVSIIPASHDRSWRCEADGFDRGFYGV